MKIVIDQNISFRIISHINHPFTEVAHIRTLGWTDTPDIVIFRNAKQQGFDAILTLDEDFDNIILKNSPPPKNSMVASPKLLNQSFSKNYSQ